MSPEIMGIYEPDRRKCSHALGNFNRLAHAHIFCVYHSRTGHGEADAYLI